MDNFNNNSDSSVYETNSQTEKASAQAHTESSTGTPAPFNTFGITTLIITINVLIYAAMVVSGVNWLSPDVEDMVKWGGNFRPETLDGGWFRLLTACFLHYGILHLLMNMYALYYIGRILEPTIGKLRFTTAYILSGVGGSVVSLYFNSYVVSAGASGAIFGMYGLYLALLTVKYIPMVRRKDELTSMIVFIVYNLAAGQAFKFDNAAHIGGLVSGFLIGRIYAHSISEPFNRSLLRNTTIGLTVGFLLIITMVFQTVTDHIGIYEEKMKRFAMLEKSALEVYGVNTENRENLLYELTERGVYYWNEAKQVLTEIERLDIPDELKQKNMSLQRYCDLRIKVYELTHRAISNDTDEFNSQIEKYNLEIEELVKKLTGA
ncbi:rhomboid family intramembrane serine protease [Flavihumibacter stibioxidans]|uniref:Peptidase S54 rhomboid domain-containing protein n=1 Tax=Flavihumibacter stibioxidans TaxID=1834163 RepID=A0ABR7MF12_9BACT|nr:rhomboid family intramembrane serine protease [Flavihumibacter stibioxidans]MBC6493119.1 hypothetical protein [Flavihumibacter stibioxidans]